MNRSNLHLIEKRFVTGNNTIEYILAGALGRARGSSFIQRRDIGQAFAFTEASAANEPEIAVWKTFQSGRFALEFGISGKEVFVRLDDFGRGKAELREGPLQTAYRVLPILVRSGAYQKEATHQRSVRHRLITCLRSRQLNLQPSGLASTTKSTASGLMGRGSGGVPGGVVLMQPHSVQASILLEPRMTTVR